LFKLEDVKEADVVKNRWSSIKSNMMKKLEMKGCFSPSINMNDNWKQRQDFYLRELLDLGKLEIICPEIFSEMETQFLFKLRAEHGVIGKFKELMVNYYPHEVNYPAPCIRKEPYP
jgi:hypothetical protein